MDPRVSHAARSPEGAMGLILRDPYKTLGPWFSLELAPNICSQGF